MTSTRSLRSTSLVGEVFDVLQLFVGERGEVREVEAQVAGIDQRARLLHVRAQHLAQRRMQQVRAGVVAHGGAANVVVDHGIDFVADANRLLGDNSVRAHALHGIADAFDVGDQRVVIVGVEPAHVADLASGLGVERSVVEHDLAALAGLELLRTDAGAVVRLDDGQHFAAGGERLAIAFELGARQRLIDAGWPSPSPPPFHEACARCAALPWQRRSRLIEPMPRRGTHHS